MQLKLNERAKKRSFQPSAEPAKPSSRAEPSRAVPRVERPFAEPDGGAQLLPRPRAREVHAPIAGRVSSTRQSKRALTFLSAWVPRTVNDQSQRATCPGCRPLSPRPTSSCHVSSTTPSSQSSLATCHALSPSSESDGATCPP